MSSLVLVLIITEPEKLSLSIQETLNLLFQQLQENLHSHKLNLKLNNQRKQHLKRKRKKVKEDAEEDGVTSIGESMEERVIIIHMETLVITVVNSEVQCII